MPLNLMGCPLDQPEYDLGHILDRRRFVLCTTERRKSRSRKPGPATQEWLMAEPTDEELAEMRKIFESCDLNGDGFIDREEFHSLLQELDGDVSREECLLDFEVADTEGDGYVGFKEFIVWWTS
jgi:Ca2+-binding EF-hand superfamily protein